MGLSLAFLLETLFIRMSVASVVAAILPLAEVEGPDEEG
eukprot:Gb_35996 [translate_table: standard]